LVEYCKGGHNNSDLYSLMAEFEYYGLKEAEDTIKEHLGLIVLKYKDNISNHDKTGGTLTVESYTWQEGASSYNDGTRNGDETASWYNNGMFIDSNIYVDHPEYSYRSNTNTGTNWCNGTAGTSYGTVVANLHATREISKFALFQMSSDGACTQVQISSHPSIEETAPAPLDENWVIIKPWSEIRAFQWAETGEIEEGIPNNYVSRVTETWDVQPFQTKYVRIQVKNHGTHGFSSYIQLRQIKAFEF